MIRNLTIEIKKWPGIGLSILFVIISAQFAFGHGGKHSDQFTHLQALQKATDLFDQLINKGKLDEKWEISLQNLTISKRNNKGKDEIVVSFTRKEGDPHSVYIFFDLDGKYSGSNFTGK